MTEIPTPVTKARNAFTPKRVASAFRIVLGGERSQPKAIVWSFITDAGYLTQTTFDESPQLMAYREGMRAFALLLMDASGLSNQDIRDMLEEVGQLGGE